MRTYASVFLLATGFLLSACSSQRMQPTPPKPPAPRAIENSLGMKFVLVPAGEFLMGSDESPDALARDYPAYQRKRLTDLADEAPVHRVRITRPFYLGQHEVTVGQFRRFIEASGYVPESIADGTGGYGYNPAYDPATSARGDAFEGRDPKYSWRNPGFAQSDAHPVLNVTWNDAVALSQWLSKHEGHTYRLPTEAEWEYACRAGSPARYFGGNDPQSLLQWANTLNDPPGPDAGSVRVRRGGSWHTWSLYARCSYRNWNSPQTRYTLVGMRLLREVEGARP